MKFNFDDILPDDFEQASSDLLNIGKHSVIVLKPIDPKDATISVLGIIFLAHCPRIGEKLIWQNAETYAVVDVAHRMVPLRGHPPYLAAMPVLFTKRMVEGRIVEPS